MMGALLVPNATCRLSFHPHPPGFCGREEVVTVDTAESLPDWETAVQSRIHGVPALRQAAADPLHSCCKEGSWHA
jgi:hypothetical protein